MLSLLSRNTARILTLSTLSTIPSSTLSTTPTPSSTPPPLKIMTFLGSARYGPPKPVRLGERVASACVSALSSGAYGSVSPTLVDPLDLWEETNGKGFKPHFAYAPLRDDPPPPKLDALAQQVQAADAFVMVSPEYNHSISPALAHLLNHLAASSFAYKPSLIVTYSAGQWGGSRSAMTMRAFLGELGCLPVSAMVHVGAAHSVLSPQGEFLGSQTEIDNWSSYFGRGLEQLVWWAHATRNHRAIASSQPAFTTAPSQRNAVQQQS